MTSENLHELLSEMHRTISDGFSKAEARLENLRTDFQKHVIECVRGNAKNESSIKIAWEAIDELKDKDKEGRGYRVTLLLSLLAIGAGCVGWLITSLWKTVAK